MDVEEMVVVGIEEVERGDERISSSGGVGKLVLRPRLLFVGGISILFGELELCQGSSEGRRRKKEAKRERGAGDEV